MTAQRQERNGSRPGIAVIGRSAGILLAGVLWASVLLESLAPRSGAEFGARASTTERVVVDRYSGLAIAGFDPVAYFTDAGPVAGLPELEASQDGAVWRFRNESNRAAFVAHPDIYAPQFGGYDPIDLARGVTCAGNPRFWLVSGERLYLFGREQSRAAFAADPQHFLREAKLRWPELEQTLAR